MKSILYIPTLGGVGEAVASYKNNMEKFGHSFPIVVADRSEEKISNKNSKQLSKFEGIYHLREKQVVGYLNSLGDTKLLQSLGLGNAMNLGFLLSLSFKADIMHRRDADTRAENFVGRNKVSEGLDVFGIHLSFIARKLEEVKIISEQKYHPWADVKLNPSEKRILAVTGGVTGHNPTSFEAFKDFPKGFFSLNPKFKDSEKLRQRISGEPVLFDESRFQLFSVNNLSGSNLCLHKEVFSKFCCPPADGVGLDDEHTGRLMTIKQMPILFAYAPVGHYKGYSEDFKEILVKDFLTKDFISARDFILNTAPDSINSPDIGLFMTTSQEFMGFRKIREKKILDAVKILEKAPKKSVRNNSLIATAKYLQRNLAKLLDSNDQYTKDYFILQEKWPELVKQAERFNIQELF